MNVVNPSPWACNKCGNAAMTYADETVWCNKCEKKLLDADRHETIRGEQRNTITPPWEPIEVE